MLLDTPICDFGWRAPDFTLKDPNGQSFTLQDSLRTKKGVLIAFICNHCPYVKAIAERFSTDCAELQEEGVAILSIMSNDYQNYPDDSPENMTRFSQKYGFNFPYLIDEDQSVAKLYGAVCTPDFFGFNAKAELQYRGRLDDARKGDGATRQRELVEAMRQISQTGQGPQAQTPSMGCSIKWR